MAYIFASGTGSAARIAALAVSSLALLGTSPLGQLDVSVENLRSEAGLIQVCVTRDAAHFPDCDSDPAARKLTASVADAAHLSFAALPSGDYAVALFHDENANGRLDTFAGIPREGVGFSRNPRLAFGPPRFDAVRVAVSGADGLEAVKLRYFL